MLNKSLTSRSVPKYFFNKITDITPEDLKSMGAQAVGIDIDNTTAYDSTLVAFKGVKEWIENIRAAGFPVIIVSNTYLSRARHFSKKFGNLPYIGNANKPKKEAFIKAAEMANTDISRFAMIGDQLFTDIQGANEAGAIPIRVKYRHREIIMGIRYTFVRRSEKKYLRHHGFGDKV